MSQIRRLAAILSADVAGYSRLIGADEGGILRRLRAIRDELVDPTVAAHNGRLVKTTGDGLLCWLSSAQRQPLVPAMPSDRSGHRGDECPDQH